MLTIKGQSISGLIAIAPLHVFHPFTPDVTRKEIKDTDTEVSRFITARDTASTIMQKLHDQALSTSGADNAAIFENYRQLLAAPEFTNQTTGIIRSQKVNFEYAVKQVEENYRQILASDNAAYASSSMADFSVVVNAVIEALQSGVQRDTLTGPCILASHDLTPEQTIRFDKSKLLGFVTVDGNSLSHTAILARSLGVPAILATGHEIGDELNGHPAIIDGFTGTVYVDPTPEIIQEMKQKQADHKAQRELLEELRGLPAETEDGRRVELSANISSAGDLAAVIKNDAESIGLFRSEFIYMGRDTLPTEEEQFKIYKLAAETMAGKRVIIRTVDIGNDKQASAFGLPKEVNPALGMRAIRVSLTRPDIFKTQLRAILRASAFGRIAIMFPLITSVWEVWKAKEILENVKTELDKNQIPYDHHLEVGIMVETPAAALISDKLAKEVDFFSIGTNDLSQYTLVVDRNIQDSSQFFNPHHPAVLKLIRMTIENAHANHIWVGICGELGADLTLTREFLEMGVDELSVAPYDILPLRKKVRSLNLSEK
ncbi:MAG: phosphoenolpyruvate--protein phosphotransferase [Allisonella histaminiformans]|uniref:Phosphoenolpyruvate-protein phosphotransferase n=1 Tax=Allisonella histaminiformans TaxID=209880 RepID=A0A1G5VMW7_9FIRM|nr:phosphoenolpyruvate--protein phosphotransferase [Allisonella histaminiformans]MCI6003771.1 phosphoenolpyruvate--protein phosphotransferase [Allisonella histaminiformans]MDY3956830.1 phosphoenolpyruvate--protein phosphotransferase [Allisonella histaminiformans]PWL45707.1 MAG: phosphoenolpyruvate--protein phosphotransferase [Veillonellaceae bacterium]SDA47209.1 phosphotransferase system, enzyme I, PtsI [Allisonella histaminiformans]